MKPNGWAWIAPWNGIPRDAEIKNKDIQSVLNYQIKMFLDHGFEFLNISYEQSKYYGINGTVANNIIFYKNLIWKSRNN